MKMINADEAKKALMGWETDPTDEEIEYTIDNLPAIDAIPIDWLKKKYPLTGVYGTESYFRTAHIVDELIKEWEAEMEKKNDWTASIN